MKRFEEMKDEFFIRVREELKQKISNCTEPQQHLFKRMYAKGDLSLSIERVIDLIPEENLEWATQQVENTLKKKEPVPQQTTETQMP